MSEDPPLWGRMFARLQGEVSAETLEAYRRASLPVFELLDQVESRRLACAMDGLNPWTVPPATRAEFLCAWNAFVLQTLGNDILDADYADYPPTAGFVPPVTAEQVLAWFSQVEGWLNRAQQAHANPDYRLDVEVPAELPPWVEADPSPESHLRGMLRAMQAVGEHAAAAMAFLPETAPDGPEQQAQLNQIRQVYAAAQTKARYAIDLHGADPPPDVHDRLEPIAREAIELFYRLGQLVADPALAAPAPERGKSGRKRAEGGRPLPGQPGFDEWCLTDPEARARLKADRRARKALRKLWERDPNPARTLAVHAEIQAALERGDVAYAETSGGRIGHWYRCPWGPIYVAKRTVTLGGKRVKALQQFIFEVGPEGTGQGGEFRRRVVTGAFRQTEQFDYGDPGRAAR